MPAQSQAQKNFMYAVKRCKQDDVCPSDKIKKAAESMSMKSIEDFTSTPSKNLPVKVKENRFISFAEYIELKESKSNR